MSKGIVGNWVMCKVLMTLFVCAFMFASAPAFAQDVAGDSSNWRFQNLNFDFYRSGEVISPPGTATHGVGAASAILSATDSGENVFENQHDGSVVHDTKFGQLLAGTFYSVPGDRDTGPIIANFERGESVNLVAVLNNVNPSIVSGIRGGNSALADAMINRITAEFSRALFGFNHPLGAFAAVRPSDVTGIPGLNGRSPVDLGFGNAPTTAYATMVIVRWDANQTSPPLIVGATDRQLAARGGLSATVGINGGVNILQRGPSNLVGVEPEDENGNHSGPSIAYTLQQNGRAEVDVTRAIDRISRFLFNENLTDLPNIVPTDPEEVPTFQGNFDPEDGNAFEVNPPVESVNSPNPVQYRSEDLVTVSAEVLDNRILDGEPDEYFELDFPNVQGSDPIRLGPDRENRFDGDGEIDTTETFLQIVATSTSGQTVNIRDLSTSSYPLDVAQPGASRILDMTFPISDTLTTAGAFEYFNLAFTVRDDVGHATSAQTQNNQLAVDTNPPLVTEVNMKAIGGSDIGEEDVGYLGSRRVSTAPGFNEAIVEVKALSGSEQLSRISSWFKFSAKQDPDQPLWTSGENVVVPTTVSQTNFVPNVPDGETLGATSQLKLTNTENVTIRQANVIISVSDDARNPAIAWLDDPDPASTRLGSVLGTSIFDGDQRYPSPEIPSNESFIAANDPSTFRVIGSATFSVDNNPPHIQNASWSVIAMPRNYWTFAAAGSQAASDTFNALRGSYESMRNVLNEDNVDENNLASSEVLNASPIFLEVVRGTASFNSSTRNQNGSPTKLVVQFDPAGLGLNRSEDIGGRGFEKANEVTTLTPQEMKSYMEENFVFSIDAPNVGWESTTANPLPSGWRLSEGTIIAEGAANIAYATLINWVGIPTTLNEDEDVESALQDIVVSVADRLQNFALPPDSEEDAGKAAISNEVIVDINSPNTFLNPGALEADFVDGDGAPAATVLLITDTLNLTIEGLQSVHGRNYRSNDTSVFTLSGNGQPDGFNNHISQTSSNDVLAGEMIVVSANFHEPVPTGGTDLFTGMETNVPGNFSVFPYLLGFQGVDPDDFIDPLETPYGRLFRTISADFSDFITTADDVLPDVTSVAGGGGIGGTAPGQIVEATWFFLINSEQPINGDIPPGEVRGATFYARDLSGNVSFRNLPIATAEFTIPRVAIENFEIHIPNRGINRATIQKSNTWEVPEGIPNATQISAATTNLDNATLTLVASITNGPFISDPQRFVSANFRPVGGEVQLPNEILFLDGTNPNSPQNATADTVVWATWVTGPLTGFNDAFSGRQVIVTATGNNLAAGQARSVNMDADLNRPDVGGGEIFEQDLNGNLTAGDFDQINDNVIRPNQTVTAHAVLHLDEVEFLSSRVSLNTLTVLGDFSSFGISGKRTPNQFFRRNNNARIVDATWLFTVPEGAPNAPANVIIEVTDIAGNATVLNGTQVFVNGSRPIALRNVLNASHVIGHPTDSFHLINQFYEVGTNINGETSKTQFGNKTVVKSGDRIRLTARFNISDPAFTDLNVWANMEEVLGPTFRITPHDPLTGDPGTTGKNVAGGIINATWTRFVNDAIPNATQARIIVGATNSAGVQTVGFATRTVPIVVDNIAPEVSIAARYFQGDDEQSDVLVPPDATAQIVVHATFPDADIFHGFAGSPVAGARNAIDNGVGFEGPFELAEDTAHYNDEATKALVALRSDDFIGSDFLLPDFWALSGRAGVFTDDGDSTDGPIVTSGSSFQAIRESTNRVLTAWYGVVPRGANIGFTKLDGVQISSLNERSARFVANVSDSIGNIGQAESAGIQVDATPPQIYAPGINSVTSVVLRVLSATELHIPAKHTTSGIVQSVTKIGPGTRLRTVFTVIDDPEPLEPVTVSIRGVEFGTEDETSIQVISNNASITSSVQRDDFDVAEIVISPSDTNPVRIQADVTVNRSGTNTFPIISVPDPEDEPPANPLEFGYGYPDNPEMAASAIQVWATDTEDNLNISDSNGFDVDLQGPKFIHTEFNDRRHLSVVGVDTLDAVRNLEPSSSALSSDNMNLDVGQWIVVAGTVVVDGTEPEHFQNFRVDWGQALEQDVARLVQGSEETGSRVIVASSTRAVRFVTTTIQIRSNASPSGAAPLRVFAEDFFGNPLSDDVDTPYILTDTVAIQAVGPRATELDLVVDGVNQDSVGASQLGMTNRGPDSAAASFEVQPNTVFELVANVNTIGGRAPQQIVADFSDLYPSELKESVNEIVPSATEISPDGTVRAVWRYIAADYTNRAEVPNSPSGETLRRAFNDIDIVRPDLSTTFKNGLIEGITPANATVIDGSGFIGNDGVINEDVNQQVLDRLIGLPNIYVQPNAVARTVARVTVTVDEEPPLNLFGPTDTVSSIFAVDTKTPVTDIQIPPDLIVRALPAGEVFTSGPRIGFPSAPNLSGVPLVGNDAIPNRLRGGDTAYFIVSITNALIDNSGDDWFRQLPGAIYNPDTLFSLSDPNAVDVLEVTNDLSDFAPELTNVVAPDEVPGSDPAFNVLSLVPQSGGPTIIKSTFAAVISPDVGTTVEASRRLREPTPTVVDDAGNRPYDTFFNNQIKRIIRPVSGGDDLFENVSIGVDNIGPTISGSLEVEISEGSAISPSNQELGPGSIVPPNSILNPGALLTIRASVNEQVDHPLDILNNPNYGQVELEALNLQIPDQNITLRSLDAALSGNSVFVPFNVRIPETEDGLSTDNFGFIIRATDTIGNAQSRESTERFQFDARPNITVVRTGGSVSEEGEVFVNAGDPTPTVLTASVFDVGGVASVDWSVTPPPETLLESGVEITSDFSIEDPNTPQNLELPLTINASISDIDNIAFAATPSAVDIDGNETVNDPVGIIVNQPALLSGNFGLSVISSAGNDITDATGLSGDSILTTADGDVREITIEEGSTLNVSITGSDVNAADTVVLAATGSGVSSDAIENVEFGDSTDAAGNLIAEGSGTLTFVPGYRAVTGDAQSATYELNVSAWDGKHTIPDQSTILVNVLAQSATPAIEVVSITIDDATQPLTLNDTIVVPENSDYEIVLRGSDAGGEEVTFDVSADTPAIVDTITSASNGIVDATVVFTPDSNSADIVPVFDSPTDPTVFTYSFANSSVTASANKTVDIENVSQGAIISASASVEDEPARAIEAGGTVSAQAGQTVAFNFVAEDPDLDRQFFPVIEVTGISGLETEESTVRVEGFGVLIETRLVLTIPSDVVFGDNVATIDYTIEDNTGATTQAQFFVDVTPTQGVPSVDEIALSQGATDNVSSASGTNQVNVRNFDENQVEPRNAVLPDFTYRASNPTFRSSIGGGAGRAGYITLGDVDNDGTLEFIDTFGPIVSATATYPNVVIPRETDSKLPVGHPTLASFSAFPAGSGNPVRYNNGDLRTTVGDFKVDGDNLIAIAQGAGSELSLVRLFQYSEDLTSRTIVGQFQPLDNAPTINNASSGVSLTAGDVDGDGVDELLAGQSSSDTSLTQFTVLDIDETGNLPTRHNFVGFPPDFRGRGGVELTVADLNGDGQAEIVAAGNGVGDTGEPGSLISVIRPIVTDNTVTGFERPGGLTVFQVIGDSEINPNGALYISSGELDGNSENGDELVFSSGNGAPQSFYRVLKLDYDGTDVTGFSFLIGPPQNLNFVQSAFVDEFNPTSGAVYVDVGNVRGE